MMAEGRGTPGENSWMDKPTASKAYRYDPKNIRPGGMSDDDDSCSSDEMYFGGFSSSKKYQKPQYQASSWKPVKTPEELEAEKPPEVQLTNACINKNLQAFKKILLVHKIDINTWNCGGGWSVLMLACKHIALEIVQFLLSDNAEVNNKSKDWYWCTPLLALADAEKSTIGDSESDLLKIAVLLLDSGASVNCVNTRGISPLMFAASHDRVQFANILIQKGATIDIYDNTGKTALHFAAQAGNAGMVRLLLETGANVLLKDEFGATPLQMARSSKSEKCQKVVQLLDWVETTEWRPGMHPDMIDVEKYTDRHLPEDVQQLMDEESEKVEMHLIMLDLTKYVPLFKHHLVYYNQLFWMNHKQLMEIGIEDEDDRNTIIESFNSDRKLHKNCPPFMREGWTSGEAVCMLSNMTEHVEYQTEILDGLNRLIKEEPELLNSGIEMYTPTDLIQASLSVTKATLKVDKSVDALLFSLEEYVNSNPEGPKSEKSSIYYQCAFYGLLTVFAAVGYIYLKGRLFGR